MPLTPTAQRWARLVAALEQSNLTATAFAAQHNVNPSTLSWWRSRLRGTLQTRAFVEVELPCGIAPTSNPPPLRVEVRAGVVVVVPDGADLRWLRAVVGALA